MGKAVWFWLVAGVAAAQSVSLTVNTGLSLRSVDEKLYGQILPPTERAVDGDVWGEVVRNRSFEDAAGGRRHWSEVGNGEIAIDTVLPLNGGQSLRIVARTADSGVEQAGIRVRGGDTLRGSLWLTGTGPGLIVRLLDGARVLAEEAISRPSGEWAEVPLQLTPRADSARATLRIVAKAGSTVKLDQVSLMADSVRDNGGFRPEPTHAIAAIYPILVRWPGGNVRSDYRWKDAVGPQAKRPGHNGLNEWDPLAFGVDEFLAFARKVGVKPVIAIAPGPPALADRAAYLRDVLDLMEYCNGSSTTIWGKQRAQNGHPEPYGVSYWEVDNGTLPPDEYVKVLEQFVPAMKAAFPGTRTIASDRGHPGERWWNGDMRVIREAAPLLDYLCVHQYDDGERFSDGPAAAGQAWIGLQAEVARSRNPRLMLFVSEWSAQSPDWRTGLLAAAAAIAMERDGYVPASAPYSWRYEDSAAPRANVQPALGLAFAFFQTPTDVVMKLYREHFAPDVLQISGNPRKLNAAATRSADGGRIFVKLMNPTDHDVPVDIALRGDFPLFAAGMKIVAPGSLGARNTLEQRNLVWPADAKVERKGMTARVTLPRWSVAVVTLSR